MLGAAEGNDKQAQYNVGRMLEKRDGVEIDNSQALRWYIKALQQGIPEATGKIEAYEKLVNQNRF